jgi:RNA polymerase sigma factor (sigma-70 family)
MTDGQLLERFASRRDEEAFAQIVRRHGPLVLGVCRQILHHEQDAEDAFQATFLVLARKAGSIRSAEALPNWLYGVANRLATRMKTAARKRQTREVALVDTATSELGPGGELDDLGPVLHEEIGRLPDKYRIPFVLCYLDGMTNEEAARQLGCPPGTVFSRLARAREGLRARLRRRGVMVASGALAAALVGLSRQASAAVPPPLARTTVRAAMRFGADGDRPGAPARVVDLAQWGVKALSGHRARTAVALLVLVVALIGLLVAVGALLLRHRPPEGPIPQPPAAEGPIADGPIRERLQGTWTLTSLNQGGVPVPGAQGRLTFKDDQMTLLDVAGTYRIDAEKDPMQIDWTVQGAEVRGIFQLRGDELTLCTTRSADFRPQPEKSVMTFQRLRP